MVCLLEEDGYQTVHVADAKQIVEQFYAGPKPDLIILDMVMGRYDGWWYLKERQNHPALAAVPVLILTAGIVTREWAQAHGAVGFVKKPINLPTLLGEIRACLEQVRTTEP